MEREIFEREAISGTIIVETITAVSRNLKVVNHDNEVIEVLNYEFSLFGEWQILPLRMRVQIEKGLGGSREWELLQERSRVQVVNLNIGKPFEPPPGCLKPSGVHLRGVDRDPAIQCKELGGSPLKGPGLDNGIEVTGPKDLNENELPVALSVQRAPHIDALRAHVILGHTRETFRKKGTQSSQQLFGRAH
jgi:hypothetical protein